MNFGSVELPRRQAQEKVANAPQRFYPPQVKTNRKEKVRRRKFLWICALIGSFAAILLIFFFAKIHLAKAAVEKKLAAFSAQGFPLTVEELHASYAYPEGENAAFLYTEAFSKIVDKNKQGESIDDLLDQARAARKTSAGKIPLETLQAADELLAANQAALNLIREGNRIGACRYPLRNYPYEPLSHLSEFKTACRLLIFEAEVRLARSDAEGAYNSIWNGFQFAQSLSKEPVFISQLVQRAGAVMMLFALEQFLNQHPLTIEQIDVLTQWLSAAQNPAQTQTALRGELCMSLLYYRKGAIQTEIELEAIDAMSIVKRKKRTWKTPFGEAPAMLGAIWIDATSLWHEYYGFMLNAFEEILPSLELPAHQRREFLALQSEKLRKIQEQSSMEFLLSEIFFPTGIVKFLEKELRFLASVRLTALALAIERYRLANDGRLPTSLESLPAKTLETYGTNPYTGERIQYFVLEKGYRLLSVESDSALNQDGADLEKQKVPFFGVSFTVER